MPRVSVLLPCRNASAHLPQAILSLEAQTFGDFEVVACDDGSSDDTYAQLFTWAQRDGRVRLVRPRGRGLVPALSTLLGAARGELVARMDADDIADPERLQEQVAFLDASPAHAACGTHVRYFPQHELADGARRYEDWINAATTHDEIVRELFVECPIPHPTLLARRGTLHAVGGYRDMGWPEDYDLVLRLWLSGHRLGKVARPLLRWREGAHRTSRIDPRYDADAFRRCKVHFLKKSLLASHDGVVVWGAGPVGKRFARVLLAEHVELRAFVDLSPRKIGQEVYGAPVIPPDRVVDYRGALICGAVGSAGARAEIRDALDAMRFQELEDYVMCA